MSEDVKYITSKRFGTTKLTRNADGFFEDAGGTIYAFKDGVSLDEANRCGIAPFALPQWPFFQELNDACTPHDFAYSSPVYQAFHTREEADDYLAHLVILSGHPILGPIFYQLAHIFGVGAWENEKTR